MRVRTLGAGAAAWIGATLSSLCCLLPLAVIVLGLGSGAFMAVTMRYRWILIPAGIVGVATGFLLYVRERRRCNAAACRMAGSRVTLALKGATREQLAMTARQRWLGKIAQPDILFILLIIGVLGLYAEFSHPGLILPGAIGVISLVLMLVAIQVLPVNAIGVLLILLAIGLFILEAKYTSHGLLGIGGAVVMIVGALFLIRSPLTGAGVSLSTALGVTIPFAAVTIFLMRLVLRSFRWKQSTGIDELVGKVAEVTEAIRGGSEAAFARPGMVFVHGELWRAVASEDVPKGTRVRVVGVEGLTLHVKPVE